MYEILLSITTTTGTSSSDENCSRELYLNGQRNEVRNVNGGLFYTIKTVPNHVPGDSSVIRLLSDTSGRLVYVLTQTINKVDLYQPPVYYITHHIPGPGRDVFSAGYGNMGEVYQDGIRICLGFSKSNVNLDVPQGDASLLHYVKGYNGKRPVTGATTTETDSDEAVMQEAVDSEGGKRSKKKMKKFFSKLFCKGKEKMAETFIALEYDGQGKWVYLRSKIPNLPKNTPADNYGAVARPGSLPTDDKEIKKDIAVAFKKKGEGNNEFLEVSELLLESDNVWLRDMVVATWLVVLWEEERCNGLPQNLRCKGLIYEGMHKSRWY